MTQNDRRSLVAIQIGTIVFTLVLFGAGLYGMRAAHKWRETLKPAKSAEALFDSKFRRSIGEPYSDQMHHRMLEIIRSGDDAMESSDSLNRSFLNMLGDGSQSVCMLGGLFLLAAVSNIFLLVKEPRLPEPNEDHIEP